MAVAENLRLFTEQPSGYQFMVDPNDMFRLGDSGVDMVPDAHDANTCVMQSFPPGAAYGYLQPMPIRSAPSQMSDYSVVGDFSASFVSTGKCVCRVRAAYFLCA